MPLSFSNGSSITRKEGFSIDTLPVHLRDLQERMGRWASEYSIDLELTYKKLIDLESAQGFFPADLPIYFAAGDYRPENLTLDDFFALLAQPCSLFMLTKFTSGEYPDFDIFFQMRNPHIRGFAYYDPDKDNNDLHLLELRPRTVVSAASRPRGPKESYALRAAFYEKLRNELDIQPYEEALEQEIWTSADGLIQIGKETASGLIGSDVVIRYADIHVRAVQRALSGLAEFTDSIVSLHLSALTGTWETVRGFLTNRRIREVFKLSKCGIDTVAGGRLGSFPDLTIYKLIGILRENVVSVLGQKWRVHYYAHLKTIRVNNGELVRQGE
jgi:hypothetical protein